MKNIIFVIIVLSFSLQVLGQALPKGFKDSIQEQYNVIISNPHPDEDLSISFEHFLKREENNYFSNKNHLETISSQKSYSSLCSNGTFESGVVNANDWYLYWNDIFNVSGSTIENGAIEYSTNMMSCNSAHNTVPAAQQVHYKTTNIGQDPYFNQLSKVCPFPMGNTHSLRLGNNFAGIGTESMSKKVVITPSNSAFSFSYAVVMGNAHSVSQQPFFKVEILNANNTNINYNSLIDLGGGSNMLISSHVLLDNSLANFSGVVHKAWDCISADLSSLIGTEVIIRFTTRDCTQGCHWGYSYIDNICLGCEDAPSNSGTIDLNTALTDTCGMPGDICINYTLPFKGNQTGTGEFTLDLIQNGIVVNSISSGILNSDSNYCFNLTSVNTSGLNTNFLGFDYKITGDFKLNNFSLGAKYIGNAAEGVVLGVNNDYKFLCIEPIEFDCCQTNLGIWNANGTPNPLTTINSSSNGTDFALATETFEIHTDATIPITELKVNIVDFQFEYEYDQCAECKDNPALWGSLLSQTTGIGNASTGTLIQTPASNTTTLNNQVANGQNVRELVWENANGAMLKNGDKFRVSYMLPPASEIPCCVNKVRVCTKISWKDANCQMCEVYTCSAIQLKIGK